MVEAEEEEEVVVVLWLVLVVLVVGVEEEAVDVEEVVRGAQGLGRGSLFSRPACAASGGAILQVTCLHNKIAIMPSGRNQIT